MSVLLVPNPSNLAYQYAYLWLLSIVLQVYPFSIFWNRIVDYFYFYIVVAHGVPKHYGN